MTTTSSRQARTTGARSSVFLTGLAALLLLLVLVQAALAGEWLAGKDTIDIHAANGEIILILAVIQCALVAAMVRTAVRTQALVGTGLFLVLVAVQLVLGFGGFDSANQARALHLPNGLLIFGLAVWNLLLARRASSEGGMVGAGHD
jgi:hypothetical protein